MEAVRSSEVDGVATQKFVLLTFKPFEAVFIIASRRVFMIQE
jgi:hypothetical protein